MRTKLICLLSVLLVLGFSGVVLAASDGTGDTAGAAVADYDIDKATVKLWPLNASDVEENMKLGLDMDSKLPGIVLLELDVDDDTTTGGSMGMASIFKSCEGGTKIKVKTPGFDVSIMIFLRDQGDGEATAWCDECTGSPRCFLKDEFCTGCGTADCYKCVTGCTPPTANCYLPTTKCGDTPECDKCYEMADECPTDIPCGVGRIIGEWYATAISEAGMGAAAPADRGRIEMPLPTGTDASDKDCYALPWKRIVYASKAQGGDFDLEDAKDASNVKWQLSTWLDTDFATSENDFFNEVPEPDCAEVTDVIPNSGKLDVVTGAAICRCDFDDDGNVYPGDLSVFLGEYGRTNCPNCP